MPSKLKYAFGLAWLILGKISHKIGKSGNFSGNRRKSHISPVFPKSGKRGNIYSHAMSRFSVVVPRKFWEQKWKLFGKSGKVLLLLYFSVLHPEKRKTWEQKRKFWETFWEKRKSPANKPFQRF